MILVGETKFYSEHFSNETLQHCVRIEHDLFYRGYETGAKGADIFRVIWYGLYLDPKFSSLASINKLHAI